MKGLLIYLVIAIPVLGGGLFYLGDGEEEWAKMKAQEQVVEPTEPVVKQKDEDIVYLEEIETQLEGMNAIEIQQHLEKHNIEYSLDEVTGYPYEQWCIIIPKGIHVIHIHWYDDRVEEIYMGIENVNETDSICIKYGIHVYN